MRTDPFDVLELCGLAHHGPALDGHSLLPLLNSPEAKSAYHDRLYFQWYTTWAVRDGDWKLIGDDRNQSLSLRYLAEPKPEVKNHAQEKPEIVARLKALHETWAKEVMPK